MARSGAYETPCIHGDNPDAVVIATALRQGLDRAGRAVAAA